MQHATLTNISPIDGRYSQKCDDLRPIMSEYGLIYFRTMVEVQWVLFMCNSEQLSDIRPLSDDSKTYLERILLDFNIDDAAAIKAIEKTTNHDVKAVEYFLQQKFEQRDELKALIPLIHFACTSEDINNLSHGLMLREARLQCVSPALMLIRDGLERLTQTTRDMPMLSRTHGQTASPTTLGKEVSNVLHRFRQAYTTFSQVKLWGKFNGAVGNFNAHHIAYPDVDWPNISQQFVESLGLCWNSHTTQIEPHDGIAELMHSLMRLNTILIDFCRDAWGYISLGYFAQKKVDNEVGSSTMPHKVNPIDFENAEGNLGLANAMAEHLANKLPISRWQRDLTDSTVLRNLGVVFGYSLIAYQSLVKGLNKLQPQADVMLNDLASRWEVLAEAAQTVMRRYGIADAYEQLKAISRGQAITQQDLITLVNGLDIDNDAKQRLRELTPQSYIGLASKLTDIALK